MSSGSRKGAAPNSRCSQRTYIVLKDGGSAEKALRAAIAEDPFYLQAHGMIGQLHLSQQKLDEALKEFEALAARQAKPVGPLTMSGVILQTQGRLDEAKRSLRRCARD